MTAVAGPTVSDGRRASGPVVGLGELLWDLLPDGPACGGAPANAACQVASLGVPAAVVSRVATDQLGDRAIALLVSLGVDCGCIQRGQSPPEGPATGTVDVTVDADGKPAYVFARDPAWDHLEWTGDLQSLAARASAVVFGTLAQRAEASRSVIRRFLGATRRECLRVFDVNLRQTFYSADVIRDSLAICEVLKLNGEELPIVAKACGVTHVEDPASAIGQILSGRELLAAAVTLGGEGSIVVAGETVSRLPAAAVHVVDTVGAGDAFTAGLVTGLLGGDIDSGFDERVVVAAHERAVALAARACGHRGAMPP